MTKLGKKIRDIRVFLPHDASLGFTFVVNACVNDHLVGRVSSRRHVIPACHPGKQRECLGGDSANFAQGQTIVRYRCG